jgi:hypothetical protein
MTTEETFLRLLVMPGGFVPEISAANKSIIGQNPPSSARPGKIDPFPNYCLQ